jgi:hypothetical protein
MLDYRHSFLPYPRRPKNYIKVVKVKIGPRGHYKLAEDHHIAIYIASAGP